MQNLPPNTRREMLTDIEAAIARRQDEIRLALKCIPTGEVATGAFHALHSDYMALLQWRAVLSGNSPIVPGTGPGKLFNFPQKG